MFTTVIKSATSVYGALLCSPRISTENGNVKITSSRDIVLQAGSEGSIQMLTSSGEAMNLTGPPGPPVCVVSV